MYRVFHKIVIIRTSEIHSKNKMVSIILEKNKITALALFWPHPKICTVVHVIPNKIVNKLNG